MLASVHAQADVLIVLGDSIVLVLHLMNDRQHPARARHGALAQSDGSVPNDLDQQKAHPTGSLQQGLDLALH